MSTFSQEYYCRHICPLFERAEQEMPWKCYQDCAYDQDMVLAPLPPKPLFYRTVPLYVVRDPREKLDATPIMQFQYDGDIGDEII